MVTVCDGLYDDISSVVILVMRSDVCFQVLHFLPLSAAFLPSDHDDPPVNECVRGADRSPRTLTTGELHLAAK